VVFHFTIRAAIEQRIAAPAVAGGARSGARRIRVAAIYRALIIFGLNSLTTRSGDQRFDDRSQAGAAGMFS
jgi:hypothetical protein